MGLITRRFEFDMAHRVMNERMKCFNLHGHRPVVEATFSYSDESTGLGYAIDFKEIKRLCGGFIDTYFDHATLLNPLDTGLINLCKNNRWNCWVMGSDTLLDINPSAENISCELFSIFDELLSPQKIYIRNLRFYETPNCWVDVNTSPSDYSDMKIRGIAREYLSEVGERVEYDIRK